MLWVPEQPFCQMEHIVKRNEWSVDLKIHSVTGQEYSVAKNFEFDSFLLGFFFVS